MVLEKIIEILKLIFLSDWIIFIYFILAFVLGFWLYRETEDEYKAKGKWIFYFFVAYIVFISLFFNYYVLFLFLLLIFFIEKKKIWYFREIGSVILGILLGFIYNPGTLYLALIIPVPLIYSNLICEGMDGRRKVINVVFFALFLILFSLLSIKI